MWILAAFFENLRTFLHDDSVYWTLFGLTGNLMWTSRFIVQWYASEKLKQSVIPKNFWHLSLVGGAIQLVYALHLWKMPVILGAILPPIIAARNLMLIAKHQGRRPGDGPPDAPLPDDGSGAPTAADPERLPAAPDGSGPSLPVPPTHAPARETIGGPVA